MRGRGESGDVVIDGEGGDSADIQRWRQWEERDMRCCRTHKKRGDANVIKGKEIDFSLLNKILFINFKPLIVFSHISCIQTLNGLKGTLAKWSISELIIIAWYMRIKSQIDAEAIPIGSFCFGHEYQNQIESQFTFPFC